MGARIWRTVRFLVARRAKLGSDVVVWADDREFQLVTWGNDRRLRLWPISEEILKVRGEPYCASDAALTRSACHQEVGQVRGSPITIAVTRRGGPDISYRTFAETPALPLSFPSSAPLVLPRHLTPMHACPPGAHSPSGPSLLTSSLLGATFAHTPTVLPPAKVPRGAATMTILSVRNRRQKAHDRLAWMEGVRVMKPMVDVEPRTAAAGGPGETLTLELELEGGERDSRAGETRSSSLQRGTDGGTAREGGETERADSVVSLGSKLTGTALGKESVHANLGEEMTSIVRGFPRVNFEKVSSSRRRRSQGGR